MGIGYNPKKDVLDLSGGSNKGTVAGQLTPEGNTVIMPNNDYENVIGASSGAGTTSNEVKEDVGTLVQAPESSTESSTDSSTESTGGTSSGSTTQNGYTSLWGDTLNETMQKLLNGEKFSYDFNEDALYQQYKDKYIKQGKLAMEDTIGQASAMTGGYGNSYAQSVGHQAYNASLENLNNIIPELYQMAYDRYNTEKEDLYNQYAMLSTQEEQDYAKWADQRDFEEKQRQFDEQYGDSKKTNSTGGLLSGGNITVDENGNLKVDSTSTAGVSNEIKKKASEFKSNVALREYLDGLEATDVISKEQSEALYTQYADVYEKYTTDDLGNYVISYSDMIKSTNGWSVDNDGGWNFVGIDSDARVKAPNGEIIRLDQLLDILVNEEGMDKGEAKNYIKKLQQKLGISSNWFFGL